MRQKPGVANRCRLLGLWMLTVAFFAGAAIPAWGATPNCAGAKKIYAENCAVCHMSNGKGKATLNTPDFTNPKWQREHKNPELIASVRNGVKLTAMPPWKGMLKSAEIDALIKCVVRGFGKTPAPAHQTSTKHPPAS